MNLGMWGKKAKWGGYQPTGERVNTSNPPGGGSGVPTETKYCTCPLPIEMIRKTSESFKYWHCRICDKIVDPKSKMLDKHIEKLLPIDWEHSNLNEYRDKINEIIDSLLAAGIIK